ncbi:hypothetical protein PanWU01x14_124410 [Parasponia andersonii]|uniref:Uncharacterized protein n=1 Tax=Parasponia andersonii TaxID=3476 RepID=A0A2P5CTJ3_PARAD|nr:hypothetical protein PanWU01x14_124410 [Parasponia andersonii]
MSTGLLLKLGKNPSAFLIITIVVSILLVRTNLGSKVFNFASDNVLYLYEDCSNHDSSMAVIAISSLVLVHAMDCALLRILESDDN